MLISAKSIVLVVVLVLERRFQRLEGSNHPAQTGSQFSRCVRLHLHAATIEDDDEDEDDFDR